MKAETAHESPKPDADSARALNRVLGFLQFEAGDALPARILATLSVVPLTLLLLAAGIGVEWLTRGGQIPAAQSLPVSLVQEHGGNIEYGKWVEGKLQTLSPENTPWNPSSDLGITGLAISARAWGRNTGPFWETMARIIPFSSHGDANVLRVPFLLITLGITCCSLLIAWIILHTLSELSASKAAGGVITRLRLATYHHGIRLGDPELAGDSANHLFAQQLAQLEEVIRRKLGTQTRCVAGALFFGLLALVIDPLLAMAGLGSLALTWAVTMLIRENTRSRASHRESQSRQALKLVKDSMAQSRLIRSLCMEVPQHLKVEHWLDKADRSHFGSRRSLSLGWAVVAVAITLVGSAWLFLAACEVHGRAIEAGLAGVQAVSLGGLMIWIRGLGRIRRHHGEAGDAASQVLHFLDKRAFVVQTSEPEKIGPLREALEFDTVSLVEGEQLFLDRVSLIAKAYQKTGLVGLERGQQEALFLLPGRLVSPLDGEIRWDRINLKLADLNSLRRQIAIVSGHNQIFHGTVLENITCGDAAFTQAQAEEAAVIARLDGFVRTLPKGYQTVIGPHGKALPEEVQFQITLARGWLRKPSVWLVTEPRLELASDWVDLLDDAMSRILGGKTVLVCPTRLTTLAACETIVVLDRGRIDGQGTHQSLSEDNALYRHLLRTGF